MSDTINYDPYYLFKKSVDVVLNGIKESQPLWRNLLAKRDSPDEFFWLTAEIEKALRQVEADLQDLGESVQRAENKKSFFVIDQQELTSRRLFVKQSEAFVKTSKEELKAGKSQFQQYVDFLAVENAKKKAAVSSYPRQQTGKYARLDNLVEKDNRLFLQEQIRQQDEMRQKQDKDVEELTIIVEAIEDVALEMNKELTYQEKYLEGFDQDLDNTSGGATKALKKINQLIDKGGDNCSYILILVLTLMLISIVMLIFFL